MSETPFEPPASGHADELLSATLDGEATAAEAAWVDAHLAQCSACVEERALIVDARTALRSLPTLDSGEVIVPFVARHRSIVRTGAAFVGLALLVVGALAVTAAVVVEPVAPDIDEMIAAHDADDHGLRPVDAVGGPYTAPTAVGQGYGLARNAVLDGKDLTSVVYASDSVTVSLFQVPGRIDWSSIDEGDRLEVDGLDVWRRTEGTPAVLMADVGHVVVVAVSDDPDAAMAALVDLPESRRDSWTDHLHDAGQRLARVFAFGG